MAKKTKKFFNKNKKYIDKKDLNMYKTYFISNEKIELKDIDNPNKVTKMSHKEFLNNYFKANNIKYQL